jgi:hypothetical protein
MSTTIKIQFKNVGSKIDSAKGKNVTWELIKLGAKPSDAPEVRKNGTTATDGDGLLTISDAVIGDEESLQLKYKIGEQSGMVSVKHTEASKISKVIESSQWLSLTLKVIFVEATTKETIKNKDLLWQTQKTVLNVVTVVKPESTVRTTADGMFTDDIEITEQETLQVKFTIDGVTDLFSIKHNEKTKNGEDYDAKRFIKLTAAATPVARIVAQPVVKADKITNPERHWLTYESLFNKDKFRKPSCEFKLSLYLIPVNDLLIWLRDDVSPEHLQTFVNSFFPDFETAHIKDLAKIFWSWKNQDSDFWIVRTTEESSDGYSSNGINVSPKKTIGNRDEMKIYVKPYAVLPYNRFDNIETSNALATKNLDGNLLKIREEAPYLWSAWKTASRSCMVRLPERAVKEKGVLWKTGDAGASIARDFEDWKYDKSHREPLFENRRENHYKLKDLNKRQDFSLKTGVQYIGNNFQGGYKHKDVIGDWLIGCLRSDYINYIDKKLAPPRDGLLILTELITITEKKIRRHPDTESVNYREGIQVRDVSILDNNKIYLAPLNIPFVDLNLKEFKEEFFFFSDKTTATPEEVAAWKKFWKSAFAAALGRTKALMLLRYGLQIVNPNQQNFLIEFEESEGRIKPTGTLVIRDLNDAAIHREAVWALCNGEGVPTQEERGGWKQLSKLDVPVLKFEFTEGRMAREGFANVGPQETGSKIEGQDFGPPGTQFLWQRFSAFVNLDKGSQVKDDPVLVNKLNVDAATEIYKNLLITMADWGMAHNKAYISCVEKHLGRNFRDINWARCPDPLRYKKFKTITDGKVEITPKIAEKATLTPGLEVNGVTHGDLSAEDKRSLETKLNLMVPELKEFFETQPCLQIQGVGFNDNTRIKLGNNLVKPEFIAATPDRLFICNKIEAEIKGILERKTFITVSNTELFDRPATYKFKDDTEYQTEIEWEEASAKVIHNFLASDDGQIALRRCRDSRWNLVRPSFTIQFTTGSDNEPFAWKRIFMKNAAKEWTDLTNEKGEIDVYKESSDEVISICPQKDENVSAAPVWLECKAAVWEGITVKIV